jgi:hypothetical protein
MWLDDAELWIAIAVGQPEARTVSKRADGFAWESVRLRRCFEKDVEVQRDALLNVAGGRKSGQAAMVGVPVTALEHRKELMDNAWPVRLLERVKHAFEPGFAENSTGRVSLGSGQRPNKLNDGQPQHAADRAFKVGAQRQT